ncbi:type II toxin-antitoxin system VapC family toxin [Nocardioides sp.]|uniref:type II toxin-antitoxin system VapC family toxin n=1 Tax=Nocardioides sp. TaxID=35761 RepID=UPI00286DD0D0|nr:type II toxin-antitoxin system VapC family toxin [Nocardioides sp.]
MIIDSSAIVAIIQAEPEAEPFLGAMRSADRLAMGAPLALETSMVLTPRPLTGLKDFLWQQGVHLVPFSAEHLEVAHAAFLRYGKHHGSAAKLNFGDCMSYALAKVRGEPLLFKGDDFTHTDIEAAWLP